MTDSAPPKSRLPGTWTSLLIAVVLVIAVGVLKLWMPYHLEQQAIDEIERVGGKVESEMVRPEWIPNAADDEYLTVFKRVISVDLGGTQISDMELEHLRELTNLGSLSLYDTQVGDTGLEYLRGLSNLEILTLGNTHISDLGLEHLRGLANLEMLFLDNKQVTESGGKKLQKALPACVIEWAH